MINLTVLLKVHKRNMKVTNYVEIFLLLPVKTATWIKLSFAIRAEIFTR